MTQASHGRPRVSVCVPSYNAEQTIEETIRSVLDSAYKDLEIIVNDDASTDHTRDVVAGFEDPRLRFFCNEANLSPACNWNRAVKLAVGEFVGLLNHDDLYGPFWITRAVHVLDTHPHIGWVMSAYRVIDIKGRTDHVTSRFSETRECSLEETFQCAAKMDGLGVGYIARRAILEQVGYYDERAGPSADSDLFLRLARQSPLFYSTYPHVAWRQHAGSLTRRWGYVEQTIETLRILHKTFDDPTLPESLRQHEQPSYAYFYQKMVERAQEAQQCGNTQIARQILQLLHTDGYR
jgi:glycosyltransferase involved in cell wall biosynthesis